MIYIFNEYEYIDNDKMYFKTEEEGCYIKDKELHIYNPEIHYVYVNDNWYTLSEDFLYPCGKGACPKLNLNVEQKIIQELLYIAPEEGY